MKAKATTVSRRQMRASVPVATAALSGLPGSAAGAPANDPAIAAVEKHRQAVQAWQAAIGDTHEADKISNQLLEMERAAFHKWLTTPPTTLAGIIATLEHASQRPYPQDPDCPDDHVYTNLIEVGECLPCDTLEAGEQFPAMVAAALRQIVG